MIQKRLLCKFILVTLFSLIIGLEQKRHHEKDGEDNVFGTDRTFTFIGILGYILYIINPQSLMLFVAGGAAITVLLSIFYFQKIFLHQKFGITSVLIALITYCIAPLIYTQPEWLVLLIVVCLLILTEIKENLFTLSQKFDHNEFISLAKFLAVAGVILPLLPDTPISAAINISPYRCWLAIVLVSGISYASYLLQKFVFPDSGTLVTGILGGLYSSTATTIILARKSKESSDPHITPAIILATTMMYLRLFILSLFFNKDVAMVLMPEFAVLIVVSLVIAGYFLRFKKNKNETPILKTGNEKTRNPLEFKTAIIFGILFIFFALITSFVMKEYGSKGVTNLAYIVGVTDIDPFIINLLQGNWILPSALVSLSILNATNSNNFLKSVYAISLSDKRVRNELIISFSVIISVGMVLSFVLQNIW